MKTYRLAAVLSAAAFLLPAAGAAQNLQDILKSPVVKEAVSSVAGTSNLTAGALEGTWSYTGMASRFESEDLLSKAGGVAMAATVNDKLNELAAKVGIKAGAFTYTFHAADSSFVNKTPVKGDLKGTFRLDPKAGTIALVYAAAGKVKLGTVTGSAVKTGNSLKLLFDADKLMDLLKKISSLSNSGSIASISALLSKYDGLSIGFELAKQP